MFSRDSSSSSAPAPQTVQFPEGVDPEKMLISAVREYRTLENRAQKDMEDMYRSLPSAFPIAEKPCENERSAFLQCFHTTMSRGGKPSTTASSNASQLLSSGGGDKNPGHVSSAAGSVPPFIYTCYPPLEAYEKCVLDRSLSKHQNSLESFMAQHAQSGAAPSMP